MIEVVVTHPVTLEKLQVIKAQSIACLQIDVSHFQRSGRMTLDGLKWEVLDNPNSKRWLFHPGLAERRAAARWRGRRWWAKCSEDACCSIVCGTPYRGSCRRSCCSWCWRTSAACAQGQRVGYQRRTAAAARWCSQHAGHGQG